MNFEDGPKKELHSISLDWRQPIPRWEVYQRFIRYFHQVDATGDLRKEVAETPAKTANQIKEVDGHMMWVRYAIARRTSTRRSVAATGHFWGVAYAIASGVRHQEMRKLRKIQYQLVNKECKMTFDKIRKIIADYALTLGLHPWQFGITTYCHGVVSAGSLVSYKLIHLKNIFEKTQDRIQLGLQPRMIPSMITRITVQRTHAVYVLAVFVVEHKNTDFTVASLADKMEHVIVVQVGEPFEAIDMSHFSDPWALLIFSLGDIRHWPCESFSIR